MTHMRVNLASASGPSDLWSLKLGASSPSCVDALGIAANPDARDASPAYIKRGGEPAGTAAPCSS